MRNDIFIDTSGFFALLVRSDPGHRAADSLLRKSEGGKRRFCTTDYVLDETATLLSARGSRHLAETLFEIVLGASVCSVIWMDSERFSATQRFFAKHADHPWSFTDCFSFMVMKELKLSEALTKDRNFKEAGFSPLLK